MNALEISGGRWKTAGFRSYRSAYMPELDIDAAPLEEKFDIILAEQVWEHLKYPYRAGRHVFSMLEPGGYFYLSVPFLVRRHDDPIDCTRWTDIGLKYYLEEVGFPPENIISESWGNLGVAIGNLGQWTEYDPSHNAVHTLENDPYFPVQTWGLGRKAVQSEG
jgi:SAM-dependent methyltransferase